MSFSSSAPLPQLPPRRLDSHKGDFGRALLVGGSRGMSGAMGLAGMATLRGGAGLVTLAVPAEIQPTVATYEPSYMTAALPCDSEGRLAVAARDSLSALAENTNCVACGPGLGRSAPITALVAWMYSIVPQPLVVDADALFALAQQPDCLNDPGGPRIWTPHPGEFRRFLGPETLTREQLESQAIAWAEKTRSVIILKGYHSLITDGSQSYHNTTGNPGMATGGSGDVLTGLITALVCQGLSPLDAARLGAHVHGLAGDLAAQQLGQVAMIASDLIRFLPQAFQQLQ